jgi:2-keto-4-pentenoate hydratase/2-oxohepta-3-ene-1,7-dioic acid hydratase in catechol pathway
MKLLRFAVNDSIYYGTLEKNMVSAIEGDIYTTFNVRKDRSYKLQDVKILAPVYPSKIIAIGINYRDHAQEFGHHIPDEPVLFIKPTTAVIGHDEAIVYPPSSSRVDFEAEIAAVVKKTAYRVSAEDSQKYILGYTCLNDVTARDLQRKDGQWTRAKSFNTFCPIGPVIETDLDPNNVNIQAQLNGETKQFSSTKNFIFPLFTLFSFISHIMTLLPGDIITTGTPSGVGPMEPGDIIEIEVEGIGVLRNRVVADSTLVKG